MNTDKKVFEKLFSKEKLELASEKYEFGVYDDIKALVKLADTASSQGKANQDKAFKVMMDLNALISKSKEYDKVQKDLLAKSTSIINLLKSNAKDLGFDYKASDAFKLNEDLLAKIASLQELSGLGEYIKSKTIS